MKKLQYTILAFFFLVSSLWAQAQPSKQTTAGKAYSHHAQFKVYDFTTKAPIQDAVVMNQEGHELGFTNKKGDLTISLPANTTEFYTIQAEGYNPMSIRLTQAEKKRGEYQVFLPAIELGYTRANATTSVMAEDAPTQDLVKVYVKQDPDTYQAKSLQGGEITFSVQVSASSNPISQKSASQEWQELGQVYVHRENGLYKVRIGPYGTQQEAKQVLLNAKAKGKNDAFIVVMQGGELAAPMNKAPKEQVAPVIEHSQNDLAEGDYKVKIASYLQPGGFNPEGIDQLGRLESYRKGEWTIMMIGGFRTLEEAHRARSVVISKGFTDASIVMDKNGILETIEEN